MKRQNNPKIDFVNWTDTVWAKLQHPTLRDYETIIIPSCKKLADRYKSKIEILVGLLDDREIDGIYRYRVFLRGRSGKDYSQRQVNNMRSRSDD